MYALVFRHILSSSSWVSVVPRLHRSQQFLCLVGIFFLLCHFLTNEYHIFSFRYTIAIFQVHAAKQRHRLSKDLFGLVQRIRKVQVRHEVLGEETNGTYCSMSVIDGARGSFISTVQAIRIRTQWANYIFRFCPLQQCSARQNFSNQHPNDIITGNSNV